MMGKIQYNRKRGGGGDQEWVFCVHITHINGGNREREEKRREVAGTGRQTKSEK